MHIDYFHGIEGAVIALAGALAHERGTTIAEVIRESGNEAVPCDCASCVGPSAAAESRAKHVAAYTNVKEWAVQP